MSVKIIIDCRERGLIEELMGMSVDIETSQLDVGDIQFNIDDQIVLIVERKTTQDLIASIKDGRYREQKYRLMYQCGIPRERIMYLFENSVYNDEKVVLSSKINTIWRDKLKVYQTNSVKETAEWVNSMREKMMKQKEWFITDNVVEQKDYSFYTKKQKKNNMNPQQWFIQSLNIIPGVTENVSIPISKEFCNLSNLMKELQKDGGNVLLKDLHTLKGRKIGPVLSKRIWEYFTL